ncbi:MAG: hypothetical protein ACYTHN_21700, partial [Planctomycetota bacterium]
MAGKDVLFQRYKVLKILGRGGVGEVLLVEDLQDQGTWKALKSVDLHPGGEKAFDSIRGEFEILARYPHPHLAR